MRSHYSATTCGAYLTGIALGFVSRCAVTGCYLTEGAWYHGDSGLPPYAFMCRLRESYNTMLIGQKHEGGAVERYCIPPYEEVHG